MIILSIETSCDETAVSVLECTDESISIRGNALASQIELHAPYGGVFPALAKRAHTEKIIPLLTEALSQAGLLKNGSTPSTSDQQHTIEHLCMHEAGLAEQIMSFTQTHTIPSIDHIAVTAGPGLEPALWVGINAATALGALWQKEVRPINHMEGHVISAVFDQKNDTTFVLHELSYPALALLVSGGHTELVLIEAPLSYKKIGETKDDAVGEAFDKVARMLGLPYPGGPKISALATEAREEGLDTPFTLPRPMLHSGEYHFSYSGLKTAVLYLVRDLEKKDKSVLTDNTVLRQIAREFEEAAIEVLVTKTKRAIEAYNAQTVIVGGGVAANTYLRQQLLKIITVPLLFPIKELSTDNSVMIGMTSYYHELHGTRKSISTIKAAGNLSISSTI